MRDRCKASLGLILVVLLGLILIHPAVAQTLYVQGSGNEFGTLDISTGDFTQIGTTTPTLYGMGSTPSGELFGLDDQGNAHLHQIDLKTAITTDLGEINQSAFAATSNKSGNLFAIDQSSPGLLYSVHPATHAVTSIGDTGIYPDGLMAFDVQGRLFAGGITTDTDRLYQLDPKTGASTLIGDTGYQIAAGVYTNGKLYGFTIDNEIVTIDTTTGAGTFLMPYSFPNGNIILSAALVTPVPAPGAFVTALLGAVPGLSLLLHRRRHLR